MSPTQPSSDAPAPHTLTPAPAETKRPGRKPLLRGSSVIWPRGLQEMLGISQATRYRWEREGKIPARDVTIGDTSGWRPETIAALIGGQNA